MDSNYDIVDLTIPSSPTKREDPTTVQTIQTRPQRLRGWVNAYYVTVGGRRCGPYYARRWKQNGKLHKEYVAENDVQRTRDACERYRESRRRQRSVDIQFTTVSGNLNFLLRMAKRVIKGNIRPEDKDHLVRLDTLGIKAHGRPALRIPRSVAFLTRNPQLLENLKARNKNSPKEPFMVPSRAKLRKTFKAALEIVREEIEKTQKSRTSRKKSLVAFAPWADIQFETP